MKRLYKNIITFLTFAALALSFTACFNPVMYQINQDVESEEAKVTGSINSIARYTVGGEEYLVIAGGKPKSSENESCGILYKKAADEDENNQYGQWKVFNEEYLPFKLHAYDYYGNQEHSGQQILKVLADSEYLYIVSARYVNDSDLGTNCPAEVHIYAAKITDWNEQPAEWVKTEKINDYETEAAPLLSTANDRGDGISYLPLYKYNDYTYSAFTVFSTNDPISANRTVYVRSGNNGTNGKKETSSEYKLFSAKYYKLNGTSFEELLSPVFINSSNEAVSAGANKGDSLINGAAYVNDTVVFFNSSSVTTNGNYETSATKFYYGNGSSVCYGSSISDIVSDVVDAGSNISSLAYCSDVLLIGRGTYASSSSTSDAGIEKVNLTDDIPAAELGTFDTNAQSQLLTSYIVMTLLNATPSKSELDSTLYASLNFAGTASSTQASFVNIGLWSYYAVRGNWNRE